MQGELAINGDGYHRIVGFYTGWMSDDGQAFLKANMEELRAISQLIVANKQAIDQYVQTVSSSDKVGRGYSDALCEIICLLDGLGMRWC